MAMAPERFRNLIETHQRMVFSIALRVTGDYGAAEEVAQDVFLELYRGSEKLESEDHIRFWLRRVSVHRATDALRRKSRQPESGAEEWLEEQYPAGPAAPAGGGVGTEIETRLEDLLHTLPEAMRVVIVLRYQEDMLPDEIATLLRQPVATVKSNLQRGLQLMRRKAEVTLKEYVR